MGERKPLIYIISGEPSGDMIGAQILRHLRRRVDVLGIGGPRLQKEGLKSLFPMGELSIMGVWGILKDLPNLLKRLSQTVDDICQKKPDVILTIDAPEFSLRVHKRLRKRGVDIPQLHLVAPSVWAWRPARAFKLSSYLDELLCLYPFEPPLFENHGLKATFVGHPVTTEPLGDAETFFEQHEFTQNERILCLLPGSRTSEINTLLPVFKKVASHLSQQFPDLKIVLPTLKKNANLIAKHTMGWDMPHLIVSHDHDRRNALAASTAALAASGTVAMQLAHAGLPSVIMYRLTRFPWWMAKLLISTPWVSIPNILLGRECIPELLQEKCTANRAIKALVPLLEGKGDQKEGLKKATSMLRLPSGEAPQQKIAEILLERAG